MKTANFPGRKNARRKRALSSMKPENAAYQATVAKLVPDAVARGIRTKKDRTASAKFARH